MAWTAAAAGVMGVRARRFVLVDDACRPRAVLAVTADGPGLVLSDATGKVRAFLEVTAGGLESRSKLRGVVAG